MDKRIGNVVAVGCALGLALAVVQRYTHVLPGSAKSFTHDRERCYGVARAGKNDCGTAKHACAAQAVADAQDDEWVMLPAGTCQRIAGGVAKRDADS